MEGNLSFPCPRLKLYKMNDSKVLILGANGMVGRSVYLYLKSKHKYVYAAARNDNRLLRLSADNLEADLKTIINKIGKIDYVINCIGINNTALYSKKEVLKTNSLFPKQLAKLSGKYGYKLIHVSTDAVFTPLSGKVTEKNTPNAKDLYGSSKLKGETDSKNSINIRTSIIGFSPEKKTGFLEWIKKSNGLIDGYTNQKWSGCTALQFAKLCEYIIFNNNFSVLRNSSNIFHFAPLGPINKYKLVLKYTKVSGRKNKINKVISEKIITRYLDSVFFDKKFLNAYTTNLEQALGELIKMESKKYE
jgi:dTDP-4-dehydrorhamnose reductase